MHVYLKQHNPQTNKTLLQLFVYDRLRCLQPYYKAVLNWKFTKVAFKNRPCFTLLGVGVCPISAG